MDKAKRKLLLTDGFCQAPAVLCCPTTCSSRLFRFAHTTDTVFAELIALPAALEALANLGFTEVTYTDGYIISKPPHSPQLFWHYDWFA